MVYNNYGEIKTDRPYYKLNPLAPPPVLQIINKMPYVKSKLYRDVPFSPETSKDDFYNYFSVSELAEKCASDKDNISNCRTIGILHSIQGKFFLSDIDTPSMQSDKPLVRVSLVYLKTPLQSPVKPYAVQIFGILQWRNRPVIFVKILQMLPISAALRVRDTYSAVTMMHQAKSVVHGDKT